MLALYLILTAAFVLLSWRDLHRGLWILVALLPSYLLRTEIFGIPTTLLEMLIVVFVIVWFLKRRPILALFVSKKNIGYLFPIALLLIASTIAVSISPDTEAALGVWKAYFVEPIVLFFIVMFELMTSELKESRLLPDNIFEALGVCALFLSLVALVQWLTGNGIPIPWDIERRVTSVFDYPNALGLFLGPIAVVSVLKITKGKRFFWSLVFLLSSIAIVLAQTEAAIVAVVTTLALAGVLNRKTRYATVVACLVAVMFVLFSPWRALVIDKLTLQDYSGQVRLTQWSETVDMLGDNWLLGAGLSGYPTAFAPYHKATHIEIFQYPHNIFLNIWIELGLLGLAAFILLAVCVLRLIPFPLSRLPVPCALAFFALLEISIHGLVDVPYFKNDLAVFTWILLAIIFAYARQTPQTKPND